jgi:hypothetical protein
MQTALLAAALGERLTHQLASGYGFTPPQFECLKERMWRLPMKLLRSTRFLLFAFLLSLVPASSHAQISISIGIAPPVLPVYVQPPCPEEGLMWTPGFWNYSEDGGYYWVPGAWVPAPYSGALWTPGYWGYVGGQYRFNEGYWGDHVGYYGGVNYGFGFMGIGFAGGEWRGGHFAYNTAIVNVNRTVILNTYVNETIVHNNTIVNNNHVAYSGGPGGIQHQPTPQEKQYSSEKHTPRTAVQVSHIQAAAKDPQQHFNNNHGKPATVASARPLSANGHNQPANNASHEAKPEHAAPQSHAATQPKTESHPAAQPKSEARPESHPAAQPRTESHPAPKAESHPAPRTESHPAPKAESHPAPRAESHPAPRAESHPAPRAESHPAPRSEPHPAPHPSKPNGEKPHER